MSRARALKRAVTAYVLWFGFSYFSMPLIFRHGGQMFYWLSPLTNYVVAISVPGVVFAVIGYFWRGGRRDMITLLAAVVVATIFWNGWIAGQSQPIPVNLIDEAAAKVGFKKCGEFQLKTGANRVVINMTLQQHTKCYFPIIRPEPRWFYVLIFSYQKVNITVTRFELSNSYNYFESRDSFGDFYYHAHRQPEFLSPSGFGGNPLKYGDYHIEWTSSWPLRDDRVFWFIFDRDYGPLGRGGYVEVNFYREFVIEARSAFP